MHRPEKPSINVVEAVPFLHVTDIDASLYFYVNGLGCELINEWRPEGKIRWCLLKLDGTRLMLQEYLKTGSKGIRPLGTLGQGLRVCLFCQDALQIYRELSARSVAVSRPYVGNGLWVTSVKDPDGYLWDFQSPTDQPEESTYDE